MNFSAIPRDRAFGALLRLPLKLLPRKARVPILQGPLRGKLWVVGSATHGCWLGSYEYEKQRALQAAVRSGDTVFDIGAHAGFYTLLASVLVGPAGRVVAFEPSPRNLSFLKEHLRFNHVRNVMVVEAAVSDHKGVVAFREGPDSFTGAISPGSALRVRSVVLDDLLQAGDIPSPDCIKIDVEGAESLVLAGARKLLAARRPTILLALHGEDQRQQCYVQLRSAGYTLQPLDGKSLEDTDEVLAHAAGAPLPEAAQREAEQPARSGHDELQQ